MKTDDLTKAEWLEKRRNYIGGSDAAAAVGQSPYRSPYQLYQDKVGALIDEPSEAMTRGLALEPLVMHLYERRFGRPLTPGPWVVSKEHSFMAATPDAIDDGINSAVQGKTSSIWKRHQWGEDGSALVPPDYYLQCQHEMAVLGAHRNQLVVLFADTAVFRALGHMINAGMKLDMIAEFVEGQTQDPTAQTEFAHFPIARDDKTIELLIKGEQAFWQRVQDRDPPADVLAPEKTKDIIEAAGEQVLHLQAMRDAAEAKKRAETDYDAAKELVKIDIGENAGIMDPDIGKVTNKAGPERPVLNTREMFREIEDDYPSTYKDAEDNARVIVDEDILLAELKIALADQYAEYVEKHTVTTRKGRSVRPYWKKAKTKARKG